MIALVSRVGQAVGSRAVAAALACAGSGAERAALLVDLDDVRPPRASPIATAGARRLEERLTAHMPDAAVASRGRFCQLTLAECGSGDPPLDWLAAALPLVREALAVVHLPPHLLQLLLAEPRVRPAGALLRADLTGDRALTALAVRDLLDRRIETVVLKRPLGRLAGRAALLGVLPDGSAVLPGRVDRLLP